jgi:hypothetical protein
LVVPWYILTSQHINNHTICFYYIALLQHSTRSGTCINNFAPGPGEVDIKNEVAYTSHHRNCVNEIQNV